MADAVLDQRFVSAVGPLVIAFMIFAGLVVFVAGCALLTTAVHRYRDTDAKHARAIADTVPELTTIHAIRDTEPGINLALADECALLYSMPAYQPTEPDLAAGCDRLWAAIRDQQQKEAGDA